MSVFLQSSYKLVAKQQKQVVCMLAYMFKRAK